MTSSTSPADSFLDVAPYYLITATHRTGSTLMAGDLLETGVLGNPSEFFIEGDIEAYSGTYKLGDFISWSDYLAKVAKCSETGWFGVKTMFKEFEELGERIPAACFERLPRSVLFYVSRRDTAAQAISMFRALQSGQWTNETGSESPETIYDFEKLKHTLEWLQHDATRWRKFFKEKNLTPVELVYEDYVKGGESAIVDLLGHFEIEGEGARLLAAKAYKARSLRQQRDDSSRTMKAQLLQDLEKDDRMDLLTR